MRPVWGANQKRSLECVDYGRPQFNTRTCGLFEATSGLPTIRSKMWQSVRFCSIFREDPFDFGDIVCFCQSEHQ